MWPLVFGRDQTRDRETEFQVQKKRKLEVYLKKNLE